MIGAILGDIIGSRFEFDRGDKTKDFTLFTYENEYTDDTVMTVAVAEALLEIADLEKRLYQTEDGTWMLSRNWDPDRPVIIEDIAFFPQNEVSRSERDNRVILSERYIKNELINSMKKWGRKYPFAGYGGRFIGWLMGESTEPYNSFGNGSAMRVSPAGWLYDTLEETRRIARWTAEVTHNHPEGIKGAESVAAVMFLARTGHSKEEIREYVIREFGYDLSRTCDEIRPLYHHVESCQETVPEAMTAFFEGESFEDVIRTAVSLGGDCDTLTDIAGAMAEAFYGVPDELISECFMRLPDDMREVLDEFDELVHPDHYITLCGGMQLPNLKD